MRDASTQPAPSLVPGPSSATTPRPRPLAEGESADVRDRVHLIAADWGTTSFRAWALNAAGQVLARHQSGAGVMRVEGDFGDTLRQEIGPWLGDAPLIMCGMVGSAQGWVDAGYVDCPATMDALARSLVRTPGNRLEAWVVPGVRATTKVAVDVMRGEETQVCGALKGRSGDSASFVLPGTHSKWVRVTGGAVTSLTTAITGELFAACREHTILGRLMRDGSPSEAGFTLGVREGAEAGTPGALLNRLFRVRTAGLSGRLGGEALADYLSGLLIGAELAEFCPAKKQAVRVIGAKPLVDRYVLAGRILEIDRLVACHDSCLDGLISLARSAGLLPSPRPFSPSGQVKDDAADANPGRRPSP